MREKKLTMHDIGREGFIDAVWKWKNEYGGTILTQLRRLGASLNWSREVLPSLDVSFHIRPRPSKFQEFLVRMDVVNRTSSEGFQVHQLSPVGDHWDLSLPQPVDTSFHMDYLDAGQALSCFFKLQNRRTLVSAEQSTTLCGPSEKAYVKLSLVNS